MEIITPQATAPTPRISDMKQRCQDIRLLMLWGEFAKNYFHKSPSWFYHKFNGIDGNGGVGGFTPEETEQFRGALYDAAERIRRVADNL